MTTVILKKGVLQNFKGLAKATKEFDSIVDTIEAKNGSGKSTFMYGFNWVLGLNAPDVIPALKNKEIPDLVTAVEFTVTINSLDYVFKREQKALTKVNKETGERIKTGNESKYFIDGIEFTLTNYKTKIENIFGHAYEAIPMLVSKEHFNNNLKWQEQRKVLFEIAKVDDVLQTLSDDPKFDLISNDIKKGYQTSAIKSACRKERLGYKDQQAKNETIIEVKIADLASYSDFDFNALEVERAKLIQQIAKAQTASRAEQKNEVIDEKLKQQSDLVAKLSKLQAAGHEERATLQMSLNEKRNELENIKYQGSALKKEIETAEIYIKAHENEIADLKKQIAERKAETYEGDTNCPYCKQHLPENMLTNSKEKWETNRKQNIDLMEHTIKERGKEIKVYKDTIEKNEPKREELRKQYESLKVDYDKGIETLNNFSANTVEIEALKTEISQIKDDINSLKLREVKSETVDKLATLNEKLNEVSGKLAYQKLITETKATITLKKDEQKELADKIAEVERKEAQLEEFVSAQVSLVNNTINSKFSNGVTFALYNELYRGGDGGLEETCICMYKDKRYTSLSTGEKYFADLEVVKALQREHNVNLPIFCDNAESFTESYTADQQIIELHAKKGKKIDGAVYVDSLI